MTTAAEFDRHLRRVLHRHILKDSSVFQTAKKLGISHSALGQLLSGKSDTGLGRSLQLAEKAGLQPIQWMRATGLFSDGSHSQLLRIVLELGQPNDPLLKRCLRLIHKCSPTLCQPLRLPSTIIEIDDLFHRDPADATSAATEHLQAALKGLQSTLRRRNNPTTKQWSEFLCLTSVYGVHNFSRSHPKEAAIGIAAALEHLEEVGPSPVTTWLLIDGAGILRRLFKPANALQLAGAAVGHAASQDVKRLYPRALLGLASIQYYAGKEVEAIDLYDLILNQDSRNPYQPIAAYSKACALIGIEPTKAIECLAVHRRALDELPAFRQIQRYWTAGRAFASAGQQGEACASFAKAIQVETRDGDVRDLFLIFEELRQLVGSRDPRLLPLAEELRTRLPELTFQFPDEFLAAEQYLRYLKELNERRLAESIGTIKEKRWPRRAGPE